MSKYPSRCKHGVILCDVCAKPPPPPKDEGLREKAAVMAREIAVLRERNRDLEQKLAYASDENYDLKQQVRQLQSVNEELRSLTSGGRR